MRLLAVALALLVATSAGAGARASAKSIDTLVFGTDVDPIILDAALSIDASGARIERQIFESLVGLAPGGTRVVPKLATSWRPSGGGRTWTFFLRQGVKFQDGTPLDAAAVCFNFERWYGFRGSLQRAAAWGWFFHGFHKPEPGSPGPSDSLYRGCRAVGSFTVRLRLARPTSSVLAVLTMPFFGIASPRALRKYEADNGEADANGVFHPAGTYGIAHPTGTGPFMFGSWRPGHEVVLVRNPRYWGHKARLRRVVFRTIVDSLARVRALKRGSIDGLDVDRAYVGAAARIKRDRNLKVLERPSANVGFVGINQAIEPMDKLLVRQAVAYGLDRRTVVRSFYGGRGELANQILPPALVGHAKHVQQYPFDPAKSRALLGKAGLKLPVKVDFWYPTDVARPYMPDPKRNFEVFAASLERAGFDVVPHGVPWSPDYIRAVVTGKAQLYLLGWDADVLDPNDFFRTLFSKYEPQLGFRNQKLFALVHRADRELNLARRARLYEQASRMVMKLLPVVPYAHFKYAVALRRNVVGWVPGPGGPLTESFATVGFASK